MTKKLNKLLTNKLAILATLTTFLSLESSLSFAATKYISIATGGITGVYYPTGGAICRLINGKRKEHGIRCAVESTGGSVANLNAIRSGAVDFGIVQSDWQYHAFNGSGFFGDQPPFKNLRSVLSLYNETFTIAVNKKSGIKNLDDIVGKRVNFGPIGSGMYATMEVLSAVKGWTRKDFASITSFAPSEQPEALCEDKIDVMVYISGNPNGVLQEATQYQDPNCIVKIIGVDKKTVNKLIKVNPFYVRATIQGGLYRENPNDIQTFGIKATLVTSSKVKEDIVYNATKAFFSNFDNFKTLHPVFASLKRSESIKDGNSAPLHRGAKRYYKEAGMLK